MLVLSCLCISYTSAKEADADDGVSEKDTVLCLLEANGTDTSMEKEFLALMLSIQNFRDYISVVPITFVLTDSQPVCWLLRHKDDNIKLSRWLLVPS